MKRYQVYLPQDRLSSLVKGEALPADSSGAALFVDISGFTPLTEALMQTLGLRRGAEELSSYLDQVYAALIDRVERYHGSVLNFAGDAITCWFVDEGDQPAALRAVACALAVQQAMQAFATLSVRDQVVSLAVKAAVACGSARRFVVGDPEIQLIDVLAGETLVRMASMEHLAHKGEVVVDARTLVQLGAQVSDSERRLLPAGGELFVLPAGLEFPEPETALPEVALPEGFADTALRSWLLPEIWERLHAGLGEFLTELRPVVTLFLCFTGIEYEVDPQAGEKLDIFIRQVQGVLTRYGGNLLQVVMGDKGSHLYAAFGAPVAHENNPRRAVLAALALQQLAVELNFVGSVQIGVSQGMLRAGAYGGTTRRTYGVLGDEVNVAARLMQAAAPGQILVSERVRRSTGDIFTWEVLPDLKVKGKRDPVAVWELVALEGRGALHLSDSVSLWPMVGRQTELAIAAEKITLTLQGKGQLVAITADAGVGKSRLVAEIIKLAQTLGMAGYGGECQSYGTNSSYLVWHFIWRDFFRIDEEASLEEQRRMLDAELAAIDPLLTPRAPLLGVALNLPIPDNELTRSFDARLRKDSLEALLVDCVRARARQGPLFFVLEDCHWLDPLSHDLLEAIARVCIDLPVFILNAYRPLELAHLQPPRISTLPNFTEIRLAEFTPEETEQLLELRLTTLHWDAADPAALRQLKARIAERAQGNPFYLEELLNYISDRGVDWHDATALANLDLPESLHNLILSRIDQLSEREKTTLKIASIIGRVFRFNWLCGYYPALGSSAEVQEDLEVLRRLDLTRLETPEPELAYLFKHVVMQEVTYASLPYATRAQLHEQLARWLESQAGEQMGATLNLLAYHYGRSENLPKKRAYLRRAGEAAQASYANDVALVYYEQLLPLLNEPVAQIEMLLKLGDVLELAGQLERALSRYQQALSLAEEIRDGAAQARCQNALGEFMEKRGEYDVAHLWLEQARESWRALGNDEAEIRVLVEMGWVHYRKGENDEARRDLIAGLAAARKQGNLETVARALNGLGVVASDQGEYLIGTAFLEESLDLKRQAGDKRTIASLLNSLGTLAWNQGEFAAARELYEESLTHFREMGYKRGISMPLNNLGLIAFDLEDYPAAKALFEESMALSRDLGDKHGVAVPLNNLGDLACVQGDYPAAYALLQESLALYREIGNKSGLAGGLNSMGHVHFGLGDYTTARSSYIESLTLAHEMGEKLLMAFNWIELGGLTATVGAGRPEMLRRAVRLAVAGEKLLQAIEAPMDVTVRRFYERALNVGREGLSVTDFETALAAGRALSADQAIHEAGM